MKKIFIMFCCLQLVFSGLWIAKAKGSEVQTDTHTKEITSKDGVWWIVADDMPEVEEEWILDPEIPQNYVPVLGEEEVYMVIGENSDIKGYRKRTQQEDGSWIWEDIERDRDPVNYEAVDGLIDVYKVTEADGSIKYLKYIRNADDTYYFVEVDQYGNRINELDSEDLKIPENYHRLKGNIYAVVNEEGVVIGYRERILSNGSYRWVDCKKPNETMQENDDGDAKNPVAQNKGNGEPEGNSGITVINPGMQTETIDGGGYKETETIIDRKTSGGWVITYQTIVVRIYDAQGKLVSTKKDGPYEISKTQEIQGDQLVPDHSKIASTIFEEYNRITSGLTIRTDISNEVLAKLNIERSANGLAPFKMSVDSDVYKIACIKAADMAIYNHADYDSPLYGDISSLLHKFDISSSNPSESLWKATATKSANDIHVRFQAQEYSRKARMNRNYTSIGIGIVEKNGYLYIAEIYI